MGPLTIFFRLAILLFASLHILLTSAQFSKSNKKNSNNNNRPKPIRPPKLPKLQLKPIYSRQALNKYLPFGVEPSAGCIQCKSSLRFDNAESKKYQVGTNIPGLQFKTKPSWAGNIAMPDTATTKNASLFFWLWGKDSHLPGDDLIIWMNGGPGCSSQVGMMQEIGPFIFPPGQDQPKPNPYSWTIGANLLFISQPVGVAFTTGITKNTNEEQISQQLVSWLFEFFKIFPKLRFNKIWIVGESYVGHYAAWQIDAYQKNSAMNRINGIKGGILFSPAFSDLTVQLDTAAYPFAKMNQNILDFKSEDLKTIKNESDTCQLTNFVHQNLFYPPRSRLPDPNANCLTFDLYYELANRHNRYFNVYNIKHPNTQLPGEASPLELFLNRTDVQDYIHAPRENFVLCKQVFADDNQDASDPPDRTPSFQNSKFAKMIEYSSNFTIVNGLLDGLVMSSGTELALQNLTWGDKQGFDFPPSGNVPLCDLEGNKRAFATQSERKLRLVMVPDAGHLVPSDEPSLSLNIALSMLGRGSLFC